MSRRYDTPYALRRAAEHRSPAKGFTRAERPSSGRLPKAEREPEPPPAVPPLRRFSWEA